MNFPEIPGHSRGMLRPISLVVMLMAAPVFAQQDEVAQPAPTPAPTKHSPFDNYLGIAAYGTGEGGSYAGGGLGGRLRIQPWRFVGVDLFGEAMLVASPHGIRHDHPIGFNLFAMFRFGRVALKPLLGACVTFSFIEPTEADAPRADDVLFGPHAGLGLEVALHRRLSFFAEGKAVLWFGHDRALQGWTGAVGGNVQPFVVGQGMVGLMFHFWERT